MKRYLFKYQISLPTYFYYCSTDPQLLTVAGSSYLVQRFLGMLPSDSEDSD